MRLRLTSLFATLALTLAFAAPAIAQTESPNADAYQGVAGQEGDGDGGDVAGVQASPAEESGAAGDSGSTLPFTGAELGIFALVGAALLGTGLVVRRVSRSDIA